MGFMILENVISDSDQIKVELLLTLVDAHHFSG